jgi:hypothetical protein
MPDLVAFFLDVLVDLRFCRCLAGFRLELLPQVLCRQNAIGEGNRNVAEVIGDQDFVRFESVAADGQGNGRAGVLARLRGRRKRHRRPASRWQADRDDLVSGFERRRARVERVAAPAEREIAP